MLGKTLQKETNWIVPTILTTIALLLTTIPQIQNLSRLQPGELYTFANWNISDAGVYASWTEQYQRGAIFHQNHFCNDVPKYHLLNVFFFLVGNFARVFSVHTLVALESSRLIFGSALAWMSWKLINRLTISKPEKYVAFALLLFGSGLSGLLERVHLIQKIGLGTDYLQPESNIFFSLLVSPLFTFSTFLYVSIIYLFHRDAENTKYWPVAVVFGLSLILSVTHTYEVLTLTAVIALWFFLSTKKPTRLAVAYLSGIVPGALYTTWALADGQINALRESMPTASYSLVQNAVGLGVLIALGAIATIKLNSLESKKQTDVILLAGWALACILATLLPLNFQRKLIMPVHIPLAILSAIGLVRIFKIGSWAGKIAAVIVPAMLLFSPFYLVKSLQSKSKGEGRSEVVVSKDDVNALKFLRDSDYQLPQVLPAVTEDRKIAVYAAYYFSPFMLRRSVYDAHWCETKNAAYKEKWLIEVALAKLPAAKLRQTIESAGIDAILVGTSSGFRTSRIAAGAILKEAGYSEVFRSGESRVFSQSSEYRSAR